MEERYEIRGKIGQGGIGSVFRGYDLRMNREVAIKRIAKFASDSAMQEESTRQLIKEAGALASLQHPHIVTIYDVGSDEDGPYVVMELISGKTLDELIEVSPFTWPDFRELALQTQEALIAAHELDMIHSDLKPSNLMLTWLPSGKFQLKIVDFGLATLSQSQSKEEIESLDAVFGSIYFMAPEQFERVPLDARSDLYSMGCVYYQALTGIYPFDGETGNDVMVSHLHHSVTPVQDLRSDIPLWACDWIMWQINRLPRDRPESARDALSVFLQNDKIPNPIMSRGPVESQSTSTRRPRLIIPGSEPLSGATSEEVVEHVTQPEVEPESVAASVPAAKPMLLVKRSPVAEPVPVEEPEPVAESVAIPEPEPPKAESVPEPVAAPVIAAKPVLVVKPATQQSTEAANTVVAASKPTQVVVSAASKTKSTPQPLAPPAGSKPSVYFPALSATPTQSALEPVATATSSIPESPAAAAAPKAEKRKLSNAAKTMIAAVLGLVTVLLIWTLMERSAQNRRTLAYNRMVTAAADPKTTEIPVTKIDFDILLDAAVSTAVVENRTAIYQALVFAKATDSTDIDASIVEYATTRDMLPDVREILIRDVLFKRKNPSVVPVLLAYTKSTTDTRTAVAALQAVRFMAGEAHIDAFLELIVGSSPPGVRKAAEDALVEVIKKSPIRNQLAGRFTTAYGNKLNPEARQSVLRLLGRCGSPKALELVKNSLEGTDQIDKIAAISALSTWGDDSAYPMLMGFIASADDSALRAKAFASALNFASETSKANDTLRAQKQWTELSGQAKNPNEKLDIINKLALLDDDWALKILEGYKGADDASVSQRAEKAIAVVNKRNPPKVKEEIKDKK